MATDLMPISEHARTMRTAISPRLATSIFLITGNFQSVRHATLRILPFDAAQESADSPNLCLVARAASGAGSHRLRRHAYAELTNPLGTPGLLPVKDVPEG